jgi:hypothetical protein
MAVKRARPKRKLYTVAEANATLPLIRAIVRDVAELANSLRERHERLTRVEPGERSQMGQAYREELEHVRKELERDQERMGEYEQELKKLGVELKDYYTGLIDFPSWMEGREVFLCWRLGEPDIGHWHELDAGFAGRRELGTSLAQNN